MESINNKVTLESLMAIVPKNIRSNITQETVNLINGISQDSEVATVYRENVLTYMNVLNGGKYKFVDYVNACRYATFKDLGDNNKNAYIKTFPDRYQSFIDNGYDDKNIHASITSYNKGKLVQEIINRMVVPIHVLFRDMHMEALQQNHYLMYNAKSETVQQKASATILEYTKAPEESHIEIDIGIRDKENIVDQYENALRFAAEEQLKMIQGGGDIKSIANIKLTGTQEFIDVEEDNTSEENSNTVSK